MSVATIRLLNRECVKMFYENFKDWDQVYAEVRDSYVLAGTMGVSGFEGEAAAEEVFDLTNNSSREEEREELYGNGRSISVGDVVNVDGVDYLCVPVGWKVLGVDRVFD